MLRHKRAQVSPEDVGLAARPAGQRGRPVEGLSQEQMDELLERTPGTYARLERGVLKGVSPEFLQQVAEVLRFDSHAWQGLWAFWAGQKKPPFPLESGAAPRIGGHWRRVVDGHGEATYLTDHAWNLLMWNTRFEEVFPDRVVPGNTMRWMMLSPDGRRRLVGWKDSWAPLVLPQLKIAATADPGNETLWTLERDMLRDPVAGPMYAAVRDAYVQPDGDVRTLVHWGWGCRVRVQMAPSEPYGAPGFRLMHLLMDRL